MYVHTMNAALRNLWYDMYEKRRIKWARNVPAGPAGRVAVIIPTYNRADLLESRALPSVMNQTYQDLQIIVANHGSTDRTHMVIYDAWDADPRVTWVDVPRTKTYPPTALNHWYAGPVHPMNAALQMVDAEFIARIDDDDEWTPDHIERSVRFARDGGHEFVSSQYAIHEADGQEYVIGHDGEDPPAGGTQTWLWMSYLRFMKWNPDCWKNEVNKVNDTDLVHRFRRAGVRMGYMKGVGCIIRPRPGEKFVGSRAYLDNTEGVEERYSFDARKG